MRRGGGGGGGGGPVHVTRIKIGLTNLRFTYRKKQKYSQCTRF